VQLAANAVSYHRQSATLETLPREERTMMTERNALRMLLKNVGDENLTRLLTPALALFASRNSRDVRVRALAQLLKDMPEIAAERARVQRMRARSDSDVFALFGRPFLPASNDLRYLALSSALSRHFCLADLIPKRRATSVVVVGDDERLHVLIEAFSRITRVVHVASKSIGVEGVETVGLDHAEDVLAEADLVVDERSRIDLAGVRRLVLDPKRLGPTEDEQLLLARRRRLRGVGQPVHERFARSIWSRLPRRLRDLVRAT
jgi:hypothetical protein